MKIEEIAFSAVPIIAAAARIVFIIVIAFFAYLVGKVIIGRAVLPFREQGRRAETLRGIMSRFLKWTVFFVALAMILSEIGINPLSLVAGLGLVGVALGLGAQSIVKDLISGFFILVEDVYIVGDFVILHLNGAPDVAGMVEELGIRSTRVQLLNGAVVSVPNGIIVNVTHYPLGYVPYFVNLVLPGELGRPSLKSWLDDLVIDLENLSKIIVERPRVVEPEALSDGRIVARLKIHIIPSKEGEIDGVIRHIKEHYKERFQIDLPEPVMSEMSEGTLKKYRSVFAPAEVIS